MKNITLFLLLIIVGFLGFSQCPINPFIQDNYELDAKILAMREILSDPSDPDYDNPFLPEERYLPYLERLSALYENPFNSPVVDSIFNKFKFHVNSEYEDPIEYKIIVIEVDNAVPWYEDFMNTGISGIAALDNLMTQYQLSIFDQWVFSSCNCTYFFLETNFEFLNMYALIDDFEAISGIDSADVHSIGLTTRFNYIGIPFYIYNEPVEVCDISVFGDLFVFTLYAGDCMAGCMYKEFRFASVTEDCEVISTPSNSFEKFSLYPNPTSDKIFLKGISSEVESIQIYTVQGKLLQSLKNPSAEIDVSQLKSGIYFMQLTSFQQNTTTLKFIKE